MSTLFTAKALLTPTDLLERPFVLVEDGHIAALGSLNSNEAPKSKSVVPFQDSVVAPGLIDMHIHGGAGRDVMEEDSGAIPALERFLAGHGVTSYFPTTVTAPLDVTLSALERLALAIENSSTSGPDRARPVGIHIEGPFLSHARRGVHPATNLLKPTLACFQQFWEASRGQIRIMTIAPELDGALEVIAEATRRGVCVSMGHSDADLAAARAGAKAGARHATHTFNAMRPLGHRDPGLLTEVLTNIEISADIIADGVHVDPAVLRLFLRLKGPKGAVLITDATAATGMPAGRYKLGAFEFEVKDGKCLANGILAGSTLTMDRAVQNVMEFGGWTLPEALGAATSNPAEVTSLKDRGRLRVGQAADFVVLSPTGELQQTVIAGNVLA